MDVGDKNNPSTSPDVQAEGSIEAPRSASSRQGQVKPKKQYPSGPPGKVLIFRTINGKVIPMWVNP
jgi:hypothetical protein